MLTDLETVMALISDAQEELNRIGTKVDEFGTLSDGKFNGLTSAMEVFGGTVETSATSLSSLLDISDTVEDIETSLTRPDFGSLISDSLGEVSFINGGYEVGATMFTIYFHGDNIDGIYDPDDGGFSITYDEHTATMDLHWTYTNYSAAGPVGPPKGSLTYSYNTAGTKLTLAGDTDSAGVNSNFSFTKSLSTGNISVFGSQNTRTSAINYGGYVNYETAAAKMSAAFTGGDSGDSGEFHLESNFGTMGLFDFNFNQNTFGSSSRLAITNQTDLLSGGVIARIENGTLAMVVGATAKNMAGTFDGTIQAFTSSGLQSTQTLTGLSGVPLTLGTGTVTGVSFSNNFQLARRFFTLNVSSGATATFTENATPLFSGKVSLNADF